MKLLVALGGNAIKQANQEGTTKEQFENCDKTAEQLAKIVSEFGPEDWMAITHGSSSGLGRYWSHDSGSDRLHADEYDAEASQGTWNG